MLPFVLVGGVPVLAGIDEDGQPYGITVPGGEVASFDLDEVMGLVNPDPAAVYYGVRLQWAESMRHAAERVAWAPKRHVVPHYKPRGRLFKPLPAGMVSGYPLARPVLERLRAEVPDDDVIRYSALFAVSTIQVQIEVAEKSFRCFVDLYQAAQAYRLFPAVSEITNCFGNYKNQKARSFAAISAYAPTIRRAMEQGLRDEQLRRHLATETDLPEGLGLAKLSFTLLLLGQDCMCMDARILVKMFGSTQEADRVQAGWGKTAKGRISALGYDRYRAVEESFLAGNRFYDKRDPIGRARAQWISWEPLGRPPRPSTHSVWLDVVKAHLEGKENDDGPLAGGADRPEVGAPMQVEARPIRIDKTKVEEAARVLVSSVATELRRRSDQASSLGELQLPQYVARVSLYPLEGLPDVRHETISAPLGIVLSLASGPYTSDVVLSGGAGVTDTGRKVIVVNINGRYAVRVLREKFEQAAVDSDSPVYQEIRKYVLHEATHILDFDAPRGDRPLVQRVPTDVDRDEYHNRPREVRAYMQEIIDQVLAAAPKLTAFEGQALVRMALAESPTWVEVESFWTDSNRNHVLKAVYRALADAGYLGSTPNVAEAGGSPAAYKGWDRRRERDEQVTVNLDPELLPLWKRVGVSFKGTPHERYEAFMQYAHTHPSEVIEAQVADADAAVEAMIRKRQWQDRQLGSTGMSRENAPGASGPSYSRRIVWHVDSLKRRYVGRGPSEEEYVISPIVIAAVPPRLPHLVWKLEVPGQKPEDMETSQSVLYLITLADNMVGLYGWEPPTATGSRAR